jgi:putative ABC transport system substrate-binding protein
MLRAVVGLLLLAAPLVAVADQSGKVWRIGFLGSTSPKTPHGAFMTGFRAAMGERGYVEGKNLVIESRWAEGDYTRLPALAEELVRQKVDLILTHGSPGARAAKAATSSIPIVIAVMGDAEATAVVSSLARPGGNITGTNFSFPELNTKRLELLKEALPSVKRVAVLMNDANPGNIVTFEALTRTARAVNMDVMQILAHNAEEFDAAFVQIAKVRAEALLVYEDALFVAHAAKLAALAERQRLPSVGFREYADGGGLLAYGVNFPDTWRRAAGFVDRIFKGAKPADVPMEQPAKFETVVNLKTAKTLKLAIPRKVLHRAETVIE